MKILSSVLLLAVSLSSLQAVGRSVYFPCAGSVVVLADSSYAASVSSKADAYTREHTPFDLAIRMDKPLAVSSEEDYLKAAAADVSSWPDAEQALLRAAFSSLDSMVRASGLHLHMPDTLVMIKTNCKEEFGAEGYTRANRIMLNTAAEPVSLHLVAHELWHVISRLNPGLRDQAYAVFHFKPCNNIVYKPALGNKVITNPDCPWLMHYATIEKDGGKQDVAFVLYTKEDYTPGFIVMQHIQVGLLALSGDDKHKVPLMKDGKPVIYELQEATDIFKQIGANTQYVLHIEEIVAEHFAALVASNKVKQPEFVDGVKAVLMK